MRLATVAMFVTALGAPLTAQAPSPQQSFEEAIEPDRPDVTNGTHIMDNGLLQLELGGLYTRNTRE